MSGFRQKSKNIYFAMFIELGFCVLNIRNLHDANRLCSMLLKCFPLNAHASFNCYMPYSQKVSLYSPIELGMLANHLS